MSDQFNDFKRTRFTGLTDRSLSFSSSNRGALPDLESIAPRPKLLRASQTGIPGSDRLADSASPLPPVASSDPGIRTYGPTGNIGTDALLALNWPYAWDVRQNGRQITYSFYQASSGPYYGSETVSEVSAAIKTNVRNILANISTYLNVNFVEVADTVSSYGVMRYMFSSGPSYAYAYYPSDFYAEGGDIHLSRNYEGDSVNRFSGAPGNHGYMALIHETFHALGLKHPGNYNGSGPGDGPFLNPAEDNSTNTVMSYNFPYSKAITPMAYDVRAAQYLYGSRSHNSSDTTYAFSDPDFYTVNGQTFGISSSTAKQSLWDSGGIDTLDFSGVPTTRYRFDLRPGGILTDQSAYNGTTYNDRSGGGTFPTSTYGTTITYRTQIENLVNSRGNDTIIANGSANRFSGYAVGAVTGQDLYQGTTASDVLDLSGFSLSTIIPQVVNGVLRLNLGNSNVVRIGNYYGSGGSMRVLIGGTYYIYDISSAWQVVAPPSIPQGADIADVALTAPTAPNRAEQLNLPSGPPPIACSCSVCRAVPPGKSGRSTRLDPAKLAPPSLVAAIG